MHGLSFLLFLSHLPFCLVHKVKVKRQLGGGGKIIISLNALNGKVFPFFFTKPNDDG